MSDSDDYQYTYQAPDKGASPKGELKTDFAMGKDMDQMKSMLASADPVTVRHVAVAWKTVEDQLGGAKAELDAAVEQILQHWEGESADGFAAQARTISQKITDSAKFANYTSTAMENAATVLASIKPLVESMQKPSETSSLLDHGKDLLTGGGRDDSGLKTALASGASTQDALDSNRGDLSKGKEAQLTMAVKMEELAVAYSAQSKSMGSWNQRSVDNEKDYPGDPGGSAPVAIIPVAVDPSVGTSTPRRSSSLSGVSRSSSSKSVTSPSTSVTSPRDAGISGGSRQSTTVSKPQVGTGLDGVSGTVTGGTGGGSTSGVSAAARGSSGGTSGVSTPGGLGGLGAVGGRTAGSGSGTAGGRTGTGGRGMPGQSGAGKSGASKTGTGKGSSLARQRGGVVGETKGGAGKGSQGGSGLHKSRGGTAAGKVGKGSGRMGGRGANTEAEEEESRVSQRPDYLVEDEETWLPDRDVAPRVIE
jgi:uncharacterized protein YukE